MKKHGNSYTEEDFQQKLIKVHGYKYTPLEKYINSGQKIKVKCNNCQNEWRIRVNNLLGGSGCQVCELKKRTKTKDEFQSELNNEYELLSDYVNCQTKVIIKCKKCNNIWSVKPTHLIHSHSKCPECNKLDRSLKQRKRKEDFIVDLEKVHNSKYKILGEYINARTPILCHCNKCNFEWSSTPNSLLNGYGCPNCNQSKGEEDIRFFLEKNNISYIYQYKNEDCKDKYVLHFDFAILNKTNDLFGLIEYDGYQHFKPVDYFGGNDALIEIKRKDEIKNKYCRDNDILLLRIPYTKKKNINEIILEWLKQ